MCTVVVLHRPGCDWPVLLAALRDEMVDRPWQSPGRHWPDRADVVAGLDELAGGSWMGLNDTGVVACVLNRSGNLGPAPGKRSRGELVLEALDHADAVDAATALADLDPSAYRPFNMVIADNRDVLWVRHGGNGDGVAVQPVPEGLSMLTARELNDERVPRIARYLPRFRAAPVPGVENDDWSGWTSLLAERCDGTRADPNDFMTVVTNTGYGTVSASLLALPAPSERSPVWAFAADWPDDLAFRPVSLSRSP